MTPTGLAYGILSFAFLNLTFPPTNEECGGCFLCDEIVFAVAHCLTQTPRAAQKDVGVSQILGKSIN